MSGKVHEGGLVPGKVPDGGLAPGKVHEGGLDKLDKLYPLVDLPALVLLQVVPWAKIQDQFKTSPRTI